MRHFIIKKGLILCLPQGLKKASFHKKRKYLSLRSRTKVFPPGNGKVVLARSARVTPSYNKKKTLLFAKQGKKTFGFPYRKYLALKRER